MQDFVHLHVHSYYSILDGQSPVKKLVDKAIADGMRGMAITDHGDMFGVKELFDYCNSVNKGRKAEGKEPFKPIFGCEMYVARRGDMHLKETKPGVYRDMNFGCGGHTEYERCIRASLDMGVRMFTGEFWHQEGQDYRKVIADAGAFLRDKIETAGSNT